MIEAWTRVGADFYLDWPPNIWRHPETGVAVLGEDMPWELIPGGA